MSLLFYGTGFPIREISVSKNASSLRCDRTVSVRWAEFSRMFFLTLSFKFQSVHVKGVVLIFSFKFSVLYNLIP